MPKRVEIVVDPEQEESVVIHCRQITPEVLLLKRTLEGDGRGADQEIVLQRDGAEYFVPLARILFFQTEGEHMAAHTAQEVYQSSYRLFELAAQLPPTFMRVSKSCIVNLAAVTALRRELSGICEVRFGAANKTVYVSRMYYKPFRQQLAECKHAIRKDAL